MWVSQLRQPLKHGVAIYFKLLVGQSIAGQRVQREQGAEHCPILIGVELAERP
jgi:hypothetical protein